MLLLVVTLQSCNQDPTLQTYFVDRELAPGFTSVDLPINVLNINEETLNEEELEAYKSIEKLSVLAFILGDEKNNDKKDYELELAKVRTVLKNPKYEELMRGGNAIDGKFVVKFIGTEESIEEIILMGHSNENGFAVVRILGDEMNVNKIMTLSKVFEKADIDNSRLDQFTDFFK